MSQRKAVIDRQAAAMKIEDYGSMELASPVVLSMWLWTKNLG
jgi:hypothetical protein